MNISYCIVTPSYHKDFEFCKILVDSIEKYVPKDIPHYLIIPKKDEQLFQTIKKDRTVFLYQEDFFPPWLKPIPFTQGKWWISLKSLPVRGWIRQQLIKLGSAVKLNEDFLILMDSDSLFTREFSLDELLKDGKAPLYCEPVKTLPPMFQKWNQVSADILSINPLSSENAIYVGICIIWSRNDVVGMLDKIEKETRSSWQAIICRQLQFSEYTLFGMYRHFILRDEDSQQYLSSTIHTLDYWEESPLDRNGLESFKKELKPSHIGAMISAKSGTDPSHIREVFEL